MVKKAVTLEGISTSVEGCRSSGAQVTRETERKLYLFGKHLLPGASQDLLHEARRALGRMRPHEQHVTRCVSGSS